MSTATVLILGVLVGAGMWSWQRGSRGMAVVFALVAALPAMTVAKATPWPALVVIAALLAVVVWSRWSRTSATVTRWGARSRRKAGVASTLDVARVASGPAVKRRAGIVRPSLAELSRWRWWRLPAVEVAVRLCRVGLLSAWSSVEDVTIVFGGPRTGKTQWLAGRVLDAPGAVLVTSHADGPVRAVRAAARAAGAGVRVQRRRPRRSAVDDHVRPADRAAPIRWWRPSGRRT